MVICFKVALHETDVHSAAQEQRKEKVSRVAKKTHTHINLLNESCLFFFFYLGEQGCAPTNLRNVRQDGLYDAQCLSGELRGSVCVCRPSGWRIKIVSFMLFFSGVYE